MVVMWDLEELSVCMFFDSLHGMSNRGTKPLKQSQVR